MSTVYKKMLQAAREIGGIVAKDAQNLHFKNNYASLESVISTTGPVLTNNGLVCEEWVESLNEVGTVACMRIVDADSGEASRVSQYPLKPVKNDPQGLASAHTYARRYLRMAMLGLAPADDDGNAASRSWETKEEKELKDKARKLHCQLSEVDAEAARNLAASIKSGSISIEDAITQYNNALSNKESTK